MVSRNSRNTKAKEHLPPTTAHVCLFACVNRGGGCLGHLAQRLSGLCWNAAARCFHGEQLRKLPWCIRGPPVDRPAVSTECPPRHASSVRRFGPHREGGSAWNTKTFAPVTRCLSVPVVGNSGLFGWFGLHSGGGPMSTLSTLKR